MKKKLVSILLAATLVCSNVMVGTAAEANGGVQEELTVEETDAAEEIEIQQEPSEIMLGDEEVQSETEINALEMKEAKAISDSITADDRQGGFVSFGNSGMVTAVLDKDYNGKIVIPNGLVMDNSGLSVKLQSNYNLDEKLGKTAEQSFDISTAGIQKRIELDNYLSSVKAFKSANLNLQVGNVSTSYVLAGKTDNKSTVLTATADSNAADAYAQLYSHMEKASGKENGAYLKKGAYIQIGNQKLAFDNDAPDIFGFGGGNISLADLQKSIVDTFALTKTTVDKDAQVKVMLPKGSYVSVGGHAGVLKADTTIKMNGFADTFNSLDEAGLTILSALQNGNLGSNTELAQALLDSVSNVIASMEGRTITVDMSFAGDVESDVKGVSLNKNELTLGVGESAALLATITPNTAMNKAVTWTSSAPQIVSVKAGVLEGLKAGKATITVTSVSNPAVSATAEVTVTAEPVEKPEIPGTEDKQVIVIEPGVETKGDGTVVIPDETVDQIADIIANAKEDEAPVITLPVAEGKTPEVSTAILEAAKESAATVVVIQTVAAAGDTKSVAATFSIDVSGDVDTSIPVKTGISPEVGSAATTIINQNIPTGARTVSLELEHNGAFPAPVIITLSVASQFKTGEKVYLYHVDAATGQMVSVDENGYVVDKNGNISVTLTHASSYVVLDRKAAVQVTGVTLDRNSLALKVGDSATLKATVAPANAADQSLTWTSSNTRVATVAANGAVQAVAAGTATITVKTGNGKTAVCQVTVTEQAASSIRLNATSAKMTTGTTKQLSVTFDPTNTTNKAISWSSSNTKAVTVDSKGTVKAIKRGSATITARTANGKTATCKITVTLAAPTVKVKAGMTSVKVSWNKVSGAAKYVVYRSTKKSGKYKKLLTTRKTSYTDKKVSINKKYYYKVLSYDSKKGAYSKVVSGTPKVAKATISSVKSGRKVASVKWKKMSGVSGYKVYMKASGGRYKLIATTKKTSLKQRKLKSKKTYYFRVKAYKKVGKKTYYGSYSATKSVKVK